MANVLKDRILKNNLYKYVYQYKIHVYVKIYNVSDDCSIQLAVSCAAVNLGLQSLGIAGNSATYCKFYKTS